MQRKGRKGHAMFRMVVQDSRYTPTSGKVVAYLGSYDPHNKEVIIDKEKASFYLEHGAKPSQRIIGILRNEKVDLPAWVADIKPRSGSIRFPDKRRSTTPKTEEEVTPPKDEPAKDKATETEEVVAETVETEAS